jgi:cytidylate kinase
MNTVDSATQGTDDPAAGPVVTISATYGAGGSVVGPRVAQRLGVDFLDRAISAAVAERVSSEAAAESDRPRRGVSRLMQFLSQAAHPFEAMPADPMVHVESTGEVERRYRAATEDALMRAAASGGVILGRSAAVVLRTVPGALHVRLDGPMEARVQQAMELEGIDLETSRQRLQDNDRAREEYARILYGVDPKDGSLYHLIIDSTALDLTTCVDLIVTASASLRRHAPPPIP